MNRAINATRSSSGSTEHRKKDIDSVSSRRCRPHGSATCSKASSAARTSTASVVVTDANQKDSGSNQHPFDVALQALGVPPERAVAIASSEPERREAEHFGLSRCVNITDTVRSIASAGLH